MSSCALMAWHLPNLVHIQAAAMLVSEPCAVPCHGRAEQKPGHWTRYLLLGHRRSASRWLALSICGNIVLAMLLAFKTEPKASTPACAPVLRRTVAMTSLWFANI